MTIPPARIPFLLCTAILLLAAPASAAQVLTSASFNPNPPLVGGGQQHFTAAYTIIPSGSSTFPRGHNLQMQTDLTGARWTIQVIVDGRDAARQTASGSAAFVNGEILSYPTNRDVIFTVTIDGTVPVTAAGPLTVLQLVEIDNTGNIVPGSQSMVSQPVGATAAPLIQTAAPTLTPIQPPAAPATAQSAGMSPVLCLIAAASAAGIALMRHRR